MEPSIFDTFENVLTSEETAAIIAFAKEKGMKRSQVINLFRPISPYRTSSNIFMKQDEFTPAVKRLAAFVAKKTGYPIDNQQWQIVHYEPGQQYKVHHDGIGHMYTMFVYLNTVEGGGGETEFPNLDRKFKPVLGEAVLWKNYKVEKWMGLEWMVRDERAKHAGLPPKQGEKWGINVWVTDDKYWKWDIVDQVTYYGLHLLLIVCLGLVAWNQLNKVQM
tara:strand:- start:5663 stop:6319 length:657 start_codon:yes stop_codon:yes gene_type:complete